MVALKPLRNTIVLTALTMAGSLLYACRASEHIRPAHKSIRSSPPPAGPLHTGMTKTEVTSIAEWNHAGIVMVTPSQFAPVLQVGLADGTDASIVFDKEDSVICIMLHDPRYRSPNGIGVGTEYGEILRRCPDTQPLEVLGYGNMVEVATGVWVGFNWEDKPLRNKSKVIWFELHGPRTKPGSVSYRILPPILPRTKGHRS